MEQVDIMALAQSVADDMVSWRRDLHQFPELGLEIPQTSAYVQKVLDEFDIPYHTLVNGNAIVGLIEGSHPGPVLAIRADMDGLPIAENTGLDFASKNGNMHACGHDGHTAILLGTAKLLQNMKDQLHGSIKLIFQPGEEYPGGAKPMLDEGAFKNPDVDHVIGLHAGSLDPMAPQGVIAYKAGNFMASMDRFQIDILGKGSHGAYPETAHDPIATAGLMINGIQMIKSRMIKATEPVVVSITRVSGGYNQNIIPDKVELEGTVRTFNDDQRKFVHQELETMAKNIAQAMGADAEVTYDYKYPAVINDSDFTQRVVDALGKVFSTDQLYESLEPRMGGEDFAYYLQEVPGTFLFLNNPREIDGIFNGHHHEKFDMEEKYFYLGVAAFLTVSFDLLGGA